MLPIDPNTDWREKKGVCNWRRRRDHINLEVICMEVGGDGIEKEEKNILSRTWIYLHLGEGK